MFDSSLFLQYNSKHMSGQAVIGLMDSAYFVPKTDLLKWINQTLQLQLNYIQDLGSGSIYCQLIDAYYRHIIPMAKVNWHAKFQYEFMTNLKLFQQGLDKLGISKKIDVNKLAKARSQDNLEMIQWLKRYLEMTSKRVENYDAVARRGGEGFYSHHATKNSFVNRPGKQALNCTMSSINLKKEGSQENSKGDRIERIKKILEGGQQSQAKLDLIAEVVYGGSSKKALLDKNTNKMEQELH